MPGLTKILKTPRSRNLIIAIVAVLILLVLIIMPLFLSNDNQVDDDQPSNEVTVASNQGRTNINDLDEYDKNLPIERHDLIKQNLFETIAMNFPDSNPTDITDVKIREGSFNQDFDDQTQIYSTSFIVDIPSIRQSYEITDSYSPTESLADYATLVLCLDDNDLIYGPFDCMDRIRWETGE